VSIDQQRILELFPKTEEGLARLIQITQLLSRK